MFENPNFLVKEVKAEINKKNKIKKYVNLHNLYQL